MAMQLEDIRWQKLLGKDLSAVVEARTHSSPRWLLTLVVLHGVPLLGCAGQLDVDGVGAVGEAASSSDAEGNTDRPGLVSEFPEPSGPDRGADEQPATGDRQALTQWMSNEATLAMLSGLDYRDGSLRQVNRRPFPSIVSPGKAVVLWVSEESYDAFSQVSTDRAGSGVALPAGTVVVREVFHDDVLETITVMAKLEAGAFPLGGDWWYVATDAEGKVRLDPDDGTPLIGLAENCGTCHLRRSNDDYLFGTPDGYL